METKHRTEVWAHRGFSSKYPENTMAAFIAALELGVDGLEFDIHLSQDGHIVVIHDENLDRTTNGRGPVGRHTLAELQRLDSGSWFNPSFSRETIPTLIQVLELVKVWDRPVTLNIEIKSDEVRYPDLEKLAFRMVRDKGLEHQVIFSSFNHFVLRDLKAEYPESRIGLLYMEGLVDPWRYAESLGASALHPYHRSFDASIVRNAQEHGIRIHTFTVNKEADMERLAEWEVDAIITDRPDSCLSLLAGSSMES